MARKVRLNMIVSSEVAGLIDGIAEDEGCTRTEVIRRALSILRAFQIQKKAGRCHIGFTSDATKLDAELVGVLTT
jgi:hypothetical protein